MKNQGVFNYPVLGPRLLEPRKRRFYTVFPNLSYEVRRVHYTQIPISSKPYIRVPQAPIRSTASPQYNASKKGVWSTEDFMPRKSYYEEYLVRTSCVGTPVKSSCGYLFKRY